MASLAKSNKYLRDPKALRRMIEENAYDSSVFEGASPGALKYPHASDSKRLKTDSSKKAAKSE